MFPPLLAKSPMLTGDFCCVNETEGSSYPSLQERGLNVALLFVSFTSYTSTPDATGDSYVRVINSGEDIEASVGESWSARSGPEAGRGFTFLLG